ncbi:unnamed protein product [Linum tenue]|uniref:Pentatricopeptide repeat-containing protein n=2 Tax=Linum tenue TaxID=586396 RepID=A0AAV0MKJ3_9ROSI|nr:unnamed protein product [Linum tenue]
MAAAYYVLKRFRLAPPPRFLCTASESEAGVGEKTLLFRKLAGFGERDEGSRVGNLLDEWVREGKSVKRGHIAKYANQLRKFKKYHHALQLYEWWGKNQNNSVNNADHAVYIDLLARTRGIAAAEEYFRGLDSSEKTHKTYGSLLSCYCRERMVRNAEQIFDEMNELGLLLAPNPLNYNNLMHLYLKVGQQEKVPMLVREMEEKNIAVDTYTWNKLMSSYALLKDTRSVEGVIKRMASKGVKHDWFTIGHLATIYVNAGRHEDACVVLDELEKMGDPPDDEAFHTLISLYGRLSDSSSVHRVWDALKSNKKKAKVSNASYLAMVSALSRLKEPDSLKACYEEWEASCSVHDIRIVNVALDFYLSQGMVAEARSVQQSVLSRGTEPNLKTLDLYMNIFLKGNQVDEALKCLETSASFANAGKERWFPKTETLNKLLKQLEEGRDVDGMERFCTSLKRLNRLSSKIRTRVERVYAAASKTRN